jgi:hypothetical protein
LTSYRAGFFKLTTMVTASHRTHLCCSLFVEIILDEDYTDSLREVLVQGPRLQATVMGRRLGIETAYHICLAPENKLCGVFV